MKDKTLLVHSGRDPHSHAGTVNTPVYHASTILFPTLAQFKNRAATRYDPGSLTYGTRGTPTTYALADAVAAAEGGHRAVITSTGLSAITHSMLAFLAHGDHVLVADTVYGPTRNFSNSVLRRFGVEVTYYDPLIGAGISELIQDNTQLVFTEAPGSMTFEMQDIPAIAAEAHKRNVLVFTDNTWGTPLFFKPFSKGVDISLQAATKYISGGSDLVIGVITAANEELWRRVKDSVTEFGDIAAPDDCYLALRGMRSMAARMAQHQESGLLMAEWLQQRPEVKRVLYPPLPDDPGHALWRRDFTGAASLFSVVLHTDQEPAVAAMLDGLKLFGMGASWGGFESLITPSFPAAMRTATSWEEPGYMLRVHIGLEDPEDLMQDLEAGLKRLTAALKGR